MRAMKGRRRQKVQAQATLTKYLAEEESGSEERGRGHTHTTSKHGLNQDVPAPKPMLSLQHGSFPHGGNDLGTELDLMLKDPDSNPDSGLTCYHTPLGLSFLSCYIELRESNDFLNPFQSQ